MKTKFTLLIISTILLHVTVFADWISLGGKSKMPAAPQVTLVSDNEEGTILQIDLSGFELTEFTSEGITYQHADLLTESFEMTPGSPELSYIAKVLAIPDQANVSFEIVEQGETFIFDNILLPPARKSWQEGDAETPYLKNERIYTAGKNFPGYFVETDRPSVFRDFRITRVSIYPMQYDPVKKQLSVSKSLTVKISYKHGNAINPKTTPQRPIPPSFDKLYKSFIFNYQSVLNTKFDSKDDSHELMLCIMPDEFYDTFLPYAQWKRESGIDIHITKFSDIGATSSSPVTVKNHIVDAYTNWEVPPTYVLLVGDGGIFPVQTSSYADENYYGEIEGNDYFPEVFVGRLTHESDYGLQVLINKFMKYEQTPYVADTAWFKKATVCSNDYYASQIYTKRFTAEVMMEDGNFFSVDTMMSDPVCTYNLSDVITALNEGRSFLNYRGEGWSSGWWASCYPFDMGDVAGLNNVNKMTFVTSIGCGVAMFNSGSCFGEEWLELGSLSSQKGAIAFIGPTGNTHTTYNNKIDKGIYVGIFQEGMDTPGEAMVRGKLYMYNVFGNTSMVSLHYGIYCILGDPSIHIWKNVPKVINVDYSSTVPIGNSILEATVTNAETGQPIADAVVCVTGTNQFGTATTDNMGHAFVEVTAPEIETFTLTVRGNGIIPFQGDLNVIQPNGPYIVEENYSINDVSGGNGDGLIDYGETCTLGITMENVGVIQADNVQVTISTGNPYIEISDSIAVYGSILPGGTGLVPDGFAFAVANDIPDEEEVSIEIEATDGNETWMSYINIQGHAPVLSYDGFTINDANGNNNGILDPGETVNILIDVANTGSSDAMNVAGDLICTDPFITINSAVQNLGTIPGQQEETAIFNLTANIATPEGHVADFEVLLSADLGISSSGDFGIVVGQIPILILDLDGNGNSAEGFEDALVEMDMTFEYSSDFPADLSLYNSIFLCLGIFPSNHTLTSSEGSILADFLNGGGNLYMEGGDTWFFDPSTAVHNMFNINGISDGSSDMGTVEGITGTFTEGMTFNYNGDNSWMDHIEHISPAFDILENANPNYGTGVAFDAGDYKTIGASHEFGGLQDGSFPSTKKQLMLKYLEFFNLGNSLQALFAANASDICESESINFTDLSNGDITSWAWTFEGGDPATSSIQNPVVTYNSEGSYNVQLIVSDGTDSDTIFIENYVTVFALPAMAPATPTGPAEICGDETSTEYNTTAIPGITEYFWELLPASAGVIFGDGNSATVFWSYDFLGDATLKVAASNFCGTGPFSGMLTISRYLPEVNLEPFEMVCVDWPSFELTGGTPAGGSYSGTGITNGWFDPESAGVGEHEITYTYTDPDGCQNVDMKTIWVDPCVGINSNSDVSELTIFPNPTTGKITVWFDQNISTVDIIVLNTLNKQVFATTTKPSNHKIILDLSTLEKGVYFIRFKTPTMEETTKIIRR
ncbi:MAG: PKD domain-containing protein [Bacteroidales bacterium]|nr:PKD domain-containing protein [Bacteroidales bacterium]